MVETLGIWNLRQFPVTSSLEQRLMEHYTVGHRKQNFFTRRSFTMAMKSFQFNLQMEDSPMIHVTMNAIIVDSGKVILHPW